MRQANKRGQDATGPERGEKAASYNGRPKSMEHERREEKTDQQSEKNIHTISSSTVIDEKKTHCKLQQYTKTHTHTFDATNKLVDAYALIHQTCTHILHDSSRSTENKERK